MKILRACIIILLSITTLQACKEKTKVISSAKAKLANVDSTGVKFQLITNGVASPIEMSIAPGDDSRRFITDNVGKIWIMKNDSVLPKPFLDISVKPVLEKEPILGSINSMAFHPHFAENRKFYVCFNAPTSIAKNKSKLVVYEYTADAGNPDEADKKSGHPIFELEGSTVYGNGAGIAFGPDGYLYISIGDDNPGDSTYESHAQDLGLLNGKILRIDINNTPYTIPADNPFIGMKDKRPEIWAYGFRKIWRFCFEPNSKELFGGDVGENKEEEIDIITKGGNYGWPLMEGDSVYENSLNNKATAFTSPINTYSHREGICVIGGTFYQGKELPALRSKYVFADFNGNVFTLVKNGQHWTREQVAVRNKPEQPFIICGLNTDEKDEIYVMGMLNTTTGSKGAIYKLVKD